MKREERKVTIRRYLVLGCSNSGTSLLTSLIGAHPQVAALCESMDMSERLVIGKPVVVNKLIVPVQIQMGRKKTLLVKTLKRFGLLKDYPKSTCSLEDYINAGTKFIFITRDREANIRSMLNRTYINWLFLWMGFRMRKITKQEAERWYDEALRIRDELKKRAPVKEVKFEELLLNTKSVMEDVFSFMELPYDEAILEYVLDAGVKYNWMYEHGRIVKEKALGS